MLNKDKMQCKENSVCVVVQFYKLYNFWYFPLFWCMLINDIEYVTKENTRLYQEEKKTNLNHNMHQNNGR